MPNDKTATTTTKQDEPKADAKGDTAKLNNATNPYQHEHHSNPLGATPGGDHLPEVGQLDGGLPATGGAGANGGPVTREEFERLEQMVRQVLAQVGAGPTPPPAQAAATPPPPPQNPAPTPPMQPQPMLAAGGEVAKLRERVAQLEAASWASDSVVRLRTEYRRQHGVEHPFSDDDLRLRLLEVVSDEGRRERYARLLAVPPVPTDKLASGPEGATSMQQEYENWKRDKEARGETVALSYPEWKATRL